MRVFGVLSFDLECCRSCKRLIRIDTSIEGNHYRNINESVANCDR
jgi:hypothetical protein